MKNAHITLTLNGEETQVSFAPYKTLLEVLREDAQLTGTKYGCELGECGACAVLLDGEPVLSCLVLGLECDGRQVLTVEGLVEDGRLHPLQEAFADLGATQCGYCTPGILVTAREYGQTVGILELIDIPHTVVGAHGGGSAFGKAGALAGRSARLVKPVWEFRPELAVAHGSVDLALVSAVLRIRSAQLQDYEFAGLQRQRFSVINDRFGIIAVFCMGKPSVYEGISALRA